MILESLIQHATEIIISALKGTGAERSGPTISACELFRSLEIILVAELPCMVDSGVRLLSGVCSACSADCWELLPIATAIQVLEVTHKILSTLYVVRGPAFPLPTSHLICSSFEW